MNIFATRVWGVRFEEIPIATFGSEGHRDRLLRLAQRGDRLLFVGTKTDRTSPEYQGRLLGMAEIGFEPLRTRDVIGRSHLDPRDFDQRGNYKFPFAVALTRAWRFVTQPFLTETLSVQLSMLATPGVEQLSGDDARIVLALENEALDLPQLSALDRMRRWNDVFRPTTGPRPSDASYTVERTTQRAASTYALQFGKRDVYKIGYAEDVSERAATINQHIPTEVLNEQWSIILIQRWSSASEAYEMEQRVLTRMEAKRTGFERLRCTEAELTRAWFSAIGD